MTSPSTCRACLRDQHHRCVGWCGCPLAHNTTTTPAPKAKPKPATAPRPARTRRTKTVAAPAPKPEPVTPPAPPKVFKPRHRRQPDTPAINRTAQRETALAFLDANGWSPAALQLLAVVDGQTSTGTTTETAA
jgi:anti-sigma factor RsiW